MTVVRYEPWALLNRLHRELETLCLSKQAARFKTHVAQEYADLIYNGLWFSGFFPPPSHP
jgi:argininosuccinate synthase